MADGGNGATEESGGNGREKCGRVEDARPVGVARLAGGEGVGSEGGASGSSMAEGRKQLKGAERESQ